MHLRFVSYPRSVEDAIARLACSPVSEPGRREASEGAELRSPPCNRRCAATGETARCREASRPDRERKSVAMNLLIRPSASSS